jgi:hypothetical protein
MLFSLLRGMDEEEKGGGGKKRNIFFSLLLSSSFKSLSTYAKKCKH